MEMEQKPTEGTPAQLPFRHEIDLVYDCQSVGMGICARAVKEFLTTTGFPSFLARDNVRNIDSNYLSQLYVIGLRHPESRTAKLFPHHPSPHLDSHLKLLTQAEIEYRGLRWRVIRECLGGDKVRPARAPNEPISPDELLPYLKAARESRLIDNRRLPQKLNIALGDDPVMCLYMLSLNGIRLTKAYYPLEESILFSEKFRPQLKKAAIHKLASMVGITEQLLYNACVSGYPFSAFYRPVSPVWQENWQKSFGEEMPGIRELYQRSVDILARHAKGDPLVAYLFTVDISQYLKS